MREKVNGNRPGKEFLKKESTSFILSANGLWAYSLDGTYLGRYIEILILVLDLRAQITMASNHQWWIGGPNGFPFCSLSADKYLRSSPCSRKGLGPRVVDGQETLACFHGGAQGIISFKENEQEWNEWRENGQDSWVLFGHVTYEKPLWFWFYRKTRLKIVLLLGKGHQKVTSAWCPWNAQGGARPTGHPGSCGGVHCMGMGCFHLLTDAPEGLKVYK